MNTCIIEINEKEYTLCLTRETVKQIEARGFNVQNYIEKPLTYTDILWHGGFLKNHADINFNLAIKLLETYQEEGGDINEVIEFLAEEYSNFVNAPADTKSKKKKKKAKIVKA